MERLFACETEEDRADWIRDIEVSCAICTYSVQPSASQAVRDGLAGEGGHGPRKVGMEDFTLLQVLRPYSVQCDDLFCVQVLGRGAFGKVVLCRENQTRCGTPHYCIGV